MVKAFHPDPDEVEQLMLNAQLRDDLEPFVDESLDLVRMRQMPTASENEFLASMLAWERAPVLPISHWFTPELNLPSPDSLDDASLHTILWEVIHRLHEKRIVLDFTEHLSDREIYCLMYRDIMPSLEKKIDRPRNYLHWDCLDAANNTEDWLRFYASEEEREQWKFETSSDLPPAQARPYPRRMPRHAL